MACLVADLTCHRIGSAGWPPIARVQVAVVFAGFAVGRSWAVVLPGWSCRRDESPWTAGVGQAILGGSVWASAQPKAQQREGQGIQMSEQRGTATALLAVVLTLTGCSSGSGVHVQGLPTPTASATSPATTSSATGFPEEQQILAQYRAFFTTLTPASKATAAGRFMMMQKVATDPALTRVLGGIAAAQHAGEVYYGQDLVRPELTKVVGMTAMLRDCQDSSGAGRLKTSTGKKVTVGRKNDLAIVTMKRGPDGVWRVSTVTYKPAGSCSAAA